LFHKKVKLKGFQLSDQAVFRAIAHPARREIMDLLALQKMSVGDVAASFEMTRPAVAKHLGILREAGLIEVSRQGRETLNQLHPAGLKSVADWLEYYSRFWDDKLETLKTIVEASND